MKAIEASELVKIYHGRRVVDGVTLRVDEGEVVGLLGPNGAGKTTTFYMVIGMTRPDEGNVYFLGQDVTLLPMYRRALMGIGYLPQESTVFRKLTVRENILAVLERSSVRRRERERMARDLMEEFNIAHISEMKGYSLSGGESRRLEIARALASSPAFLLLDEPFTGIDPIMVAELQKIISALKGRGIGILVTDHNVRETLEITDRAYIINEGQVLESGRPHEIAASEKARQVYLGDKFQIDYNKHGESLTERVDELTASMKEILNQLKHLDVKEERSREQK